MNNSMMKIGSFEVQSIAELERICEKLASSSIVPKVYQGRPNDIFVAGLYGSQLGISLLPALNGIAVINGRPSIWGDALLGLARSRVDFVDITEEFDDKTQTATCTVIRAGQKDTIRHFSMDDAKCAKLNDKVGPWTQYPKRMLQMRARGFALRDAFADALSGFITREEAEDIPVEERDITPAAKKKGVSGMLERMKAKEAVLGEVIPDISLGDYLGGVSEKSIDRMLELIEELNISRETQERWLYKAAVENLEEIPEDAMLKIVAHLESLIPTKEAENEQSSIDS